MGRSVHQFYGKLKFALEISDHDGKRRKFARCLICKRIQRNTSIARLKYHRNVCEKIQKHSSQVESETVEGEKNSHSQVDPYTCIEKTPSVHENKKELIWETENELFNSLLTCDILHNETNPPESPYFTNIIPSMLTFSGNAWADTGEFPSTIRKSEIEYIPRIYNSISDEEINSAISQFLLSTNNLNSSILNNVHFQQLINLLQRNYILPTLGKITNFICENFHQFSDISFLLREEDIQNGNAIVSITIPKEYHNVAAAFIQLKKREYFLKSWNLLMFEEEGRKKGHERSTIGNLQEKHLRISSVIEIIKECIRLCSERFSLKVYAFIIDIVEDMSTLKQVIQERFPSLQHLWIINSNETIMNLVIEDVLNLLQLQNSILPQVLKMLKYYGNYSNYPLLMKRITIFNFVEILENYLKLCQNIQNEWNIPEEHENSAVDLLFSTYDNNLHEKVTYSLSVLKKINNLYELAREPNTKLSQFIQKWLEIKLPRNFEMILHSKGNFILSDLGLASNFIHPQYKGRILTESQLYAVEDFFFANLSFEAVRDYFHYKFETGPFKDISETICNQRIFFDAINFWEEKKANHSELATLALKLLHLPVSIAHLEELYTKFALSNNSDEVKSEDFEKLQIIYMNFNLTSKK